MGEIKVSIEPKKIWDFFQDNKERLTKEMVVIAENEDTNYAVYLTEENGYPKFSVCRGDDPPEYEEGAINERDCADTSMRCCVRYLFPVTIRDDRKVMGADPDPAEDEFEDGITRQDMEDMEYERSDKLQFALCDFLAVVLEEDDCGTVMNELGQDMLNTILDHFLRYLAKQHGLEIYRPMLEEDEDGGIVFVDYPYNYLIEDDDLPT